jgi:protein-tyrosine phosphatase
MSIDSTADSRRHHAFPTLFNFRDIGGYQGADGRTVRWNTVYRADGVHRLAAEDLAPLGVRTVLDLRTHGELDERGRFEAEGVAHHHLPLIPRTWQDDLLPDDNAADYLSARYLEMLDAGGANLAAALAFVADADRLPLVFHCAAGKDRTGVVAALTLGLLGVADDDIAVDYALSGLATENMIRWLEAEYPDKVAEIRSQPTVYFEAPADAMHRFLGAVRERWGSLEACAVSVGVADEVIAGLRSNLLE